MKQSLKKFRSKLTGLNQEQLIQKMNELAYTQQQIIQKTDFLASFQEELIKENNNTESKSKAEFIKTYRYTPDPKNTDFWHGYYNDAEEGACGQFDQFIKPIIDKYPDIVYDQCLDFACGFGRIANIFKQYAVSITLCDINDLAVEQCKKRFTDWYSENSRVCRFKFNTSDDSLTLPFPDESFSFIYSWDAMVHFKYKWLDYYLHEFSRISKSGAYIMIHHSNYGSINPDMDKSENFEDNPAGRANVTSDDIAFIAKKHWLDVVEQKVIDWGGVGNLDCISLLFHP